MANLNLSEFTEKLFVADADHTFIWDTQNAISKRVSRNSWLNSGTLTSDAPVTISQTWNAVGQTFKALVVNAAGTSGTNSASGSLLADFQTGGVSQVSINKDGRLLITTQGGASTPSILIGGGGAGFYQPTNTQISFASNSSEAIRFTGSGIRLGLNELGFGSAYNSNDTILVRDSASGNTLALRNGAAAQTFRVYNTYTDASNYERAVIGYSSNILKIGQEKLGTGTDRGTEVNGGLYLNLLVQGSAAIGIGGSAITFTKNLVFGTDNSYDIGASGAARPRNLYLGTSMFLGSGTGTGVYHPTNGGLAFQSSGVVTVYGGASYTTFDKFQIGGVTSAFPTLKRVGAELQVVIASTTAAINVAAGDTDLTFIEDRYRRKGAGTPEGVVTAPIGAVYHNTTGGANTSFYVKESGTGNTGWVGK